METFGQVRIRLSEHRHLCHLSSTEAGTRAVSFHSSRRGGTKHGSRRKARQFCKVKHLREQHVRGRASSYAAGGCVGSGHVGGETLDGAAASLLAPKTIPTSPAYITATITVAVVYCS